MHANKMIDSLLAYYVQTGILKFMNNKKKEAQHTQATG